MRHVSEAARLACAAGTAAILLATPVGAETALEQSCRLLATVGANEADAVAPMMAQLTARWPEQNRMGATDQITGLLDRAEFAGGNVYELARLGDDMADHLVVLRLAAGETIGVRLTYEWTPDTMTLTRMDIRVDYATELGVALPVAGQPMNCS